MKTKLINTVSRHIYRAGFQLKKHSPEILAVTGAGFTIAGGVLACKATLKVNEVVEPAKEDIEKIHTAVEKGKTNAEKPYDQEDAKKDLAIVYVQTGIKLVKLYALPAGLMALGIGGMLGSSVILRKRNIGLAAAYATLDQSFKGYRGRVVERFGTDLDRELRYNIKAAEVEETTVDKKGKEKKVTKVVDSVNPELNSDYARFFDASCAGWEKDAEHNLTFLKLQQNYANELLQRRGHLYLNEVYDMLGIDRTKAGQVVGWIYDKECPIGDNYVDFGIYNGNSERCRAFVNGHEPVILLDFNVDGDILNHM